MKERKDEFLIIRVPSSLKEKLLARAKKAGMKLSKYVRQQLDA